MRLVALTGLLEIASNAMDAIASGFKFKIFIHFFFIYAPAFRPSLRTILSIRHHWVRPLWRILAPTKAVNAKNHSLMNHGLAGAPRASEIRINVPAIMRTSCQDVMMYSLEN